MQALFCFRLVGSMVTLSPECCYVVEDDDGLMGYCVAALDARHLQQQQQMAWLPAMREKYPKPQQAVELTPAEVLHTSP